MDVPPFINIGGGHVPLSHRDRRPWLSAILIKSIGIFLSIIGFGKYAALEHVAPRLISNNLFFFSSLWKCRKSNRDFLQLSLPIFYSLRQQQLL